MRGNIKLIIGVLLGFFGFIGVAYVTFLVVTLIMWLLGVA